MITVHQKLSLTKTHRGRTRVEPRPEEEPAKPTSSVPRISRRDPTTDDADPESKLAESSDSGTTAASAASFHR
jgi:hypothetical protein